MHKSWHTNARLAVACAVFALGAAACSDPGVIVSSTAGEPTSTSVSAVSATDTPERDAIDDRFDLPPQARASNGGGAPRPPAYWAVWNSCAPDNRAEEAAANGGPDAGWVLVDDVLADPGIQLGDLRLTSCEESLALLEGRDAAGEDTSDPAYALAAQLLAAELSLSIGAETCPSAEESVVGAHLVLAAAGFDGVSTSPLNAEAGGALPELVDLLIAYGAGDLCR